MATVKKDTGEIRVVNEETGGAKGLKPQRFELIPWQALAQVAEIYHYGAQKYTDPYNWTKGYNWSLSIGAQMRHIAAFASGEDNDPESGLSHQAHSAWHSLTLLSYMRIHPELDDRHKGI